jgi:hypothetical protein
MLVLSRTRIVRFALIIAAPVLVLGLLSQITLSVYGPIPALKNLRHFTFDSEQNMSSWLSSALLLAGALLTLWIAHADEERRRFWTLQSIVMLFCSIDETVSFHEALITIFGWMRAYSTLLYYPWVLFALIFCAGYGLYALKNLSTIGRPHFVRFVASGLVFVAGALVMEVVSGFVASRAGEDSLSYALSTSLEDILETFGVILYLDAAATYLLELLGTTELRLRLLA